MRFPHSAIHSLSCPRYTANIVVFSGVPDSTCPFFLFVGKKWKKSTFKLKKKFDLSTQLNLSITISIKFYSKSPFRSEAQETEERERFFDQST